ncbi:restriction endonuclease [Actinospica robiniae]|uniref:restriction endonuclease n=1 Tax=Actinospica robiniae TaxID=304901 RepID=UPI00040675CD|nr:restriction endonuclease [Actinospica robiniae]
MASRDERKTPAQMYREFAKQQQAEKRQQAAAAKKAADAEAKRQRDEQKRLEAEQRRAERAEANREAKERAENARAVAAVLRGIDSREAQSERTAKAQAAAYERKRKADEIQALRDEADRKTDEVTELVEYIDHILAGRDRDLADLRTSTDVDPQADDGQLFADAVCSVLNGLNYLQGRDVVTGTYEPEARRLVLQVDLPRKTNIPVAREYKYVASKKLIEPIARKDAEVQVLYRKLVAGIALSALDYTMQITSPELVVEVVLNGHSRGTDPATGQKINPCLVTVQAEREQFGTLVLDSPELDAVQCLHHLKALITENPYDLIPVTPIIDLEFLKKYKLAGEVAALAALDHRTDLMKISPYEFEKLIQQLAEAMGMKSWRTQNSQDDGIDAIAYREEPFNTGVCVIQAKRYSKTVPVEAVRALYGSMAQKKAATGIVVTTSKFGKASYDYAREMGRITLYDGTHLKALLLEHMGLDVLIGRS